MYCQPVQGGPWNSIPPEYEINGQTFFNRWGNSEEKNGLNKYTRSQYGQGDSGDWFIAERNAEETIMNVSCKVRRCLFKKAQPQRFNFGKLNAGGGAALELGDWVYYPKQKLLSRDY